MVLSENDCILVLSLLLTVLVSYSNGDLIRDRRRCENGGTEISHEVCRCAAGWTGTHCEKLNCQNGATYHAHAHSCECAPHYTGKLCENVEASFLCKPNTCSNGHCYHDNTNYFCNCFDGYTGRHCTDRIVTQAPANQIDLCRGILCHNGGHCYHDNTNYFCRCLNGYTGKYCESRIVSTTVCSSSPCQHGGHCYEDNNTFFCNCPAAYTGRTCESLVTTVATPPTDYCAFAPCIHGYCTNTNTTFKCFCDSGFKGLTCAEAMTSCTSNPCLHGGHCYDDNVSYVCACKAGFSGTHCEIDLSTMTVMTTAQAQQMTTTGYPTCNDLRVIESLGHGRIDHPYATTCPNSNKQSDAVVMQFCGSQSRTSWKMGVQVTANCKNLPKYVPVGQWHNGKFMEKTGVFLACNSQDGFEYFTQTCDEDYKLTVVQWPVSDTFFVIEN